MVVVADVVVVMVMVAVAAVSSCFMVDRSTVIVFVIATVVISAHLFSSFSSATLLSLLSFVLSLSLSLCLGVSEVLSYHSSFHSHHHPSSWSGGGVPTDLASPVESLQGRLMREVYLADRLQNTLPTPCPTPTPPPPPTSPPGAFSCPAMPTSMHSRITSWARRRFGSPRGEEPRGKIPLTPSQEGIVGSRCLAVPV